MFYANFIPNPEPTSKQYFLNDLPPICATVSLTHANTLYLSRQTPEQSFYNQGTYS